MQGRPALAKAADISPSTRSISGALCVASKIPSPSTAGATSKRTPVGNDILFQFRAFRRRSSVSSSRPLAPNTKAICPWSCQSWRNISAAAAASAATAMSAGQLRVNRWYNATGSHRLGAQSTIIPVGKSSGKNIRKATDPRNVATSDTTAATSAGTPASIAGGSNVQVSNAAWLCLGLNCAVRSNTSSHERSIWRVRDWLCITISNSDCRPSPSTNRPPKANSLSKRCSRPLLLSPIRHREE